MPLTSNVIQGALIQVFILWINSWKKPNFSRMRNMKEWLTLSKTLAMSSLVTIPSSPASLLEWITSCTRTILLRTFICCMNSPWFYTMEEGSNYFNRFAIIFVKILYFTLHKEMRRKWENWWDLIPSELKPGRKSWYLHPDSFSPWSYLTSKSRLFLSVAKRRDKNWWWIHQGLEPCFIEGTKLLPILHLLW